MHGDQKISADSSIIGMVFPPQVLCHRIFSQFAVCISKEAEA
jgi:hypothetical protein